MGNEEKSVQLDQFEMDIDNDLEMPLVEEKEDEELPLLAETQMTVSHLRREREMDIW